MLLQTPIKFDKYDRLGDYHWKCFENKQAPYSRHAALVAVWVRERPVLDVGCGDGLITHLFGKKAIGIDNCETAIRLAKRHGVNARLADAGEFLTRCRYRFPAIYLGDIIEHLAEPMILMRLCFDKITSAGHLYISTPPKLKSGKPRPYHVREYTMPELLRMGLASGFEPVKLNVAPALVQMYGKFRKP